MTEAMINGGGIMIVTAPPVVQQIVYLDFDGELTSYNGEILTIDNVVVEDSGLNTTQISAIADQLNEDFADRGVIFVTERPADGDFSTVYIGKTSSFEEYGTFAGLAETIDAGNLNKSDNAFVILSGNESATAISDTIAHEVEHIVFGMTHAGSGLSAYAATYEGEVVDDELTLYDGDTANSTTVDWGGCLHISDGGVANSTTIKYMGYLHISDGGVANSTTVDMGGYLHISDGGVANSTTIEYMGYLYVFSGGTATDTIMNTNGKMYVSSGGTAINTTVNSGGIICVSGVANSVTVNSRGSMYIYRGGSATDLAVMEGGRLDIAVAPDTYIRGTVHGSAFEVKNATLNNYTINSGCSVSIFSGGAATGLTVNASSYLHIYNGGSATDIIWTPCLGYIGIEDGAHVTFASQHSGVYFGSGNQLLSSAATMNYKAVYGSMYVMSDGTATSTTVNSGGYLYISRGGVANSTTVNSDGRLYISDAGVANNTTVTSGGNLYISRGGEANNTTVNSFSYLHVSCGGVATSTTVDSGGRLYISGDGVANSTTVGYSGSVDIASGGTANRTTVNGGGELSIARGGVATSTTVDAGGNLYIASGGTATDIIWTPCEGLVSAEDGAYVTYVSQYSGVYFGSGNQLLSSAATMNNNVVTDTTMYVMSDGTATGTTVSRYGSMYISSGGVANSTTVNSGGYLHVSCGGVATNTTVNSYGSMFISKGGVATGTTVNSGGRLSISSGGTATDITVSEGGRLGITVAPDTYIQGTFNGSAFEMKDATIDHYTVNSGGSMNIINGTANDTTVKSYGRLSIFSGGVANSTTVNVRGSMYINSGGVANRATVNSGGYLDINNGGVANSATVSSGGSMYINSGGVANSATVNSGGSMYINNGGVATSTTVSSGGSMYIYGGVATHTTVNSGGSMYIYNGGIMKGSLEIADGGVVTFAEGGRIDFTVAEQESADIALINDLSRITDNGATYTLTIAEDQAFGDYILAGNAAAFDKTITVKMDDDELGKFSVGGYFIFDNVFYKLDCVDGNLVFTHGDFTPPTLNIVVNQKMTLDYEFVVGISEQAQLQYSIDEGEWQDVDGTTIAITQNGTYRFRATDLAGNTSEVVTKEISGLIFRNPEKTETNGGKTTWTPKTQPAVVQYSMDDFKTAVTIVTTGTAFDIKSLPANAQWRVKGQNDVEWVNGGKIIATGGGSPKKISAVSDGVTDIFFAQTGGTWSMQYQATHHGIKGGWEGSQDVVSLRGKGKIADVFSGAGDVDILYLTDSSNGDALFVDDIFGASFEGIAQTQARIAKLDEIHAGAGDDIVDMTSQRFAYVGSGVTIYGGDGNDVIWSNKGNNKLFGDAGDDQIIGASGNDVIVGGAGDDTMHGGGGKDIFCFGGDWGNDTVEQLYGGSVTLWFEDGSEDNWNAETLTYTDGENTVTVSGTADVTLKFGGDISSLPDGVFADSVTGKIFEDTNPGGILA